MTRILLRLDYLPFVELCPFLRAIMIFCNLDISKPVTARSSKLGQLIEEMSRSPCENIKNINFVFSSYSPLRFRVISLC